MSDYVHEKVVRLPVPQEILIECDPEDPDIGDCEGELERRFGDLWGRGVYKFKIGFSDKDGVYYIDWVYYSTYGEESGDWGYARYLTEKELSAIKPYFQKLGVDFKDSDLRVVEYCYYNCCEPTDYYEVDNDDSELFFKK